METDGGQQAFQARPDDPWRIPAIAPFTASQKQQTTILVGGLTRSHDMLLEAALRALDYRVRALPQADVEAFRHGRALGNRGQCNPAYFTVGNLIKTLLELRDREGLSTEEILRNYVFLTAGACGPCRFGVYAAEFRKALRDAGFEGFRVFSFQQAGFFQTSAPHTALDFGPRFFLQIIRIFIMGDVLNVLSYRLRPYETLQGATDRVLDRCREICYEALLTRRSLSRALRKCRRLFEAIEVDRLVARPKVEITGEFWAQTTEGDGNYRLQRFLEGEGAEVIVTPLTAWLLYLIWEHRYDTHRRIDLPRPDSGLRGLKGRHPKRRLVLLKLSEWTLRRWFERYARAVGLHHYTLPDMETLAAISRDYYPLEVRGGEGHLEVGRLIQASQRGDAHMVISVKPFGCLPSSCISDGIQAIVTHRHPDVLFCSIETTGDAAVNAYSRIQMMLHRARQCAEAELRAAMRETGVGLENARERIARSPRLRSSLHVAPSRFATTAANVLCEAANGVPKQG